MAEWIRAFRFWLYRRRRLNREIRFRREMGLPVVHRREAARQSEAGLRGLFSLLPLTRTKRGPFFHPLLIALATTLVVLLDPLRAQLFESISGVAHAQRFIPLTPAGIVPMGFAVVVLAMFLMVGAVRTARGPLPRRNWRILLYATLLLVELAFAGVVLWVVGMQSLLSWRWGNDRIQGLALCYFAFGYLGLAWQAMRRWWRDVELRCPLCLRLLGMHEVHGRAHALLVEPAETESICLYGHGAVLESRWRRSFSSAV